MERERKGGRKRGRGGEGRERDGIEGMGGKRKEERDGMVEEGGEGWYGRGRRRGKGREGRVKRYIQRGQLKEWECRRLEVRGGEKLTREWVPTCLFTQMLSTDAVPSLLLMSLPSPHPPFPVLVAAAVQ